MAIFDDLVNRRLPDDSGLFGHLLRNFGAAPDDTAQPGTPQAPIGPGNDGASTTAPATMLGDFGQHVSAGLQSFANSGALIPALVNGLQGFVTGERTDPAALVQAHQRDLEKALIERGVDPRLAPAVARDPGLLRSFLNNSPSGR